MPTMTLKQVREQYPQYEDMSDRALADALHERHYSDMPREDFDQRIGLSGGQQSTAADVGRSALSGVRQGIESAVGVLGDANQLQGDLVGWAAEKFGASPETQETVRNVASRVSPMPLAPSTQQVRSSTDPVLGEAYEPQTTAGEYARTGGQFLPAAAAGPGGVGRRLVAQALLPAAGSETAGQMAEGTAAEPYARVGGALAGGLAPSAVSRAVSPFRTSPQRQQAAQTLQREGVETTAGQRTGSRGLRYAESEIGGGRAANIAESQGEQFTSAVLRRAGIDAKRATPDVVDDAFTRIGGRFDELAANNQLVPDGQMVTGLRSNIDEYQQLVPESARAPIVENVTRDIVEAAQKGPIAGSTYQSLRSRIDRAARGAKRDPELAGTLRGIKDTLDDAMERSIATQNPSQVGAWRDARNQYRNMLVIEKAATGAGEQAAQGIISPSALRNATVSQGRRAYARGQGDFADLARSGETLMKPLPQSGTAPRMRAQNLGAGIGTLLGGTGGAAIGGTPGALAGMLAGSAAPRVAGAAMMSRPGQAYLSNQIGSALPASDPRAGIAAALLARPEALPSQ